MAEQKVPLDTKHREYRANMPLWTKCRDAVGGEDVVKKKTTTYLPMLSGMLPVEYSAYRKRAMFYGAAERTIQGLTGAVVRRPPKIEVPKDFDIETVGPFEEPLDELIKTALRELVTVGRVGLYIDAPKELENAPPFIDTYVAEDIINWRYDIIEGKKTLVLVVLREAVAAYKPEDIKKLNPIMGYRYRYLELLEGKYTVSLWKRGDILTGTGAGSWVEIGDPVVPTVLGGKTLGYIPFVFVSPYSLTPTVVKPPLLDLVNVNFSHYRTSADLEHGRHFTALPTPWAAGFAAKDKELKIGSAYAWVTTDPQAKAGFLEFTGQGLGHLRDALQEKQHLMAVLGARLLEEQKKATEAAATVRLRQTGESSVLASIAMTLSAGLKKAIDIALAWHGSSQEAVVELNTDFYDVQMDAPMLLALMQALQQGNISWETWFYQIKKGEIVAEDVDSETERDRIEAGTPGSSGGLFDKASLPPSKPSGDDEEEEEEEEEEKGTVKKK